VGELCCLKIWNVVLLYINALNIRALIDTVLFSSSKLGHIGQIISTGAVWEIGTSAFTPPTANEIETFVHVVIQVVVGIVTIYATVRKMFQKPETVVKLPAVGAVVAPPVAPAPASADSTSTDAGYVAE
jgi:hypothetical protein